jgi:hypothetical protein
VSARAPEGPNGLYVILETPAVLAGMAFPATDTDWAELERRGFRRVLRLHPGNYDPSPLSASEIVLEDLFGGRAPGDATMERDRVLRAARLAASCVLGGEGVVVHCVGGTGRSGTVLGCALRYLGYSASDAVELIRAHRPRWPESPWQEEVVRGVEPS